ncbi:MAG: class I SAM-dependent methyltransferase [Planctomycetaceae bacterium]
MSADDGDQSSTRELALLRELAERTDVWAAIDAATGSELQVQTQLRKQFAAELVRAALELRELRVRAAEKFSRASLMWLTRQSLEQATPEAVARHKARRFAAVGQSGPAVLDLCTGIGGDAIALTDVVDVIGHDLDPALLQRAEWNVAAYGHASRFTSRVADVTTVDLTGRLVHLDPDRRSRGSRSIRLEHSQPSLEFLQQLAAEGRGGAIKVSPASNFGGKFPAAEIELVSLHGECKEATIWYGELRGDAAYRATSLPTGVTIAGHPLAVVTDVRPPGRYVYDPDPAVVRAGLVDLLAAELSLWRLDDSEEYLSGDTLCDSPFVTPFDVLDDLPANDRIVRQSVREARLGSVEIKCRHVKIDPPAIRRKLPLDGDGSGVLIYARLAGKTRVLRCIRVARGHRAG